MMFDFRSAANSSVLAKMIEPSLGLIVMPVQAGATDGPTAVRVTIPRIAVAWKKSSMSVLQIMMRFDHSFDLCDGYC
jgi:hypothetical protein